MKKNKKGFTLAELLGVIVILLLLVLIVTPIFINYSKKASKSAYEVQINTIKESAREWALDEDNIKLLPTKENECVEITLEKLKEIGLLDYNITNPKTKAKFSDESTVIIRKEGKELTYTYNENGEETCDTVITTDYPRWVFISSTPAVASDTDEVTVNIKSDRKISEESLDPEDITVKVGSQIVDDAVVTVSCSGVNPLACEIKINNLDGDGRLSLVIDKDTMKDEDLNPSRITNIQTTTMVDTSGPKITYTGKTNTNSSIYYATKEDTVKIKFKAEDNGEVVNELAAEDIIVYLDGVPVDCGKSLTTSGSGTKVDYELTLTNVTGNGKLSIKIPTGKIKDNRGNINDEKIVAPGITYDNIAPEITYSPNGSNSYVRNINVRINAKDNETGVNEDTLKYIFTTDINATPNVAIANGGKISKDSVTGDYYIIGYVCDYAGNCAKVPSNIYKMNNSAPEIEITPDHNSGYEREASIKIKATSHGEALDEGSLKYIVSKTITDTPTKSFTNNENISISNLTGEYYVIATACDVAGLCTTKTSQKFYFDNEAPAISYDANGHDWIKSINVDIDVTDNVAVDWAKYILTNNSSDKPTDSSESISNGSKTVTISSLTGLYYLVTTACDELDNCKTSKSNVYKMDNTGPNITFGTNGNNTYAKSQSSKVTVSDSHIGTLQNLKYVWSKSSTGSAASGTAFTNKEVLTKDNHSGDYYLCLYAEDGLGNSPNTCSNVFKLDNEGPTITFGTNGNSTAAKSQSTTVNVTDAKNGTVKNLKYVWSTSSTASAKNGTSFSNNGTITKNDDSGNYYLCVYAEDGLGNSTNTCSNAFKLDNEGPTITFDLSAGEYHETKTVNISISDNYTASPSVQVIVKKNNVQTSNTTANRTSASVNLSESATYSITVTATDSLGNSNTSSRAYTISLEYLASSSTTPSCSTKWHKYNTYSDTVNCYGGLLDQGYMCTKGDETCWDWGCAGCTHYDAVGNDCCTSVTTYSCPNGGELTEKNGGYWCVF